MKRLITLILCSALALNIWAQTDTTGVKKTGKEVEIVTDEWGDTTHIRVGNQSYKVIEGSTGTVIKEANSGKGNVVTVSEVGDNVNVVVGEKDNRKEVEIVTDEWGDTTHIRVGNQSYKVIEGSTGTVVKEVKAGKKNVVTVSEDGSKVQVVVGDKDSGKGVEVITDEWGDTTHIRVGRRSFKVIEGSNGTYVKVEKEHKTQKWSGRFNPHWAGLEVGMNNFLNSDYSIYSGTQYEQYGEVFELNPGKSLTWNLNFMEFAFKNEKKTFGLVTGMGLSFNDYAFDLPVTIEKQDGYGMIVPVNISEQNSSVKKSKLHVNYLTAPLMLEIKTPLRMGSSNLYLAGGAIGSLYLGSHTKYKYQDGNKFKAESNYHINQWKYDLTGRIGFGDFCVFANYSMTPLFKEGKGPKIHPLLIGISFPNI